MDIDRKFSRKQLKIFYKHVKQHLISLIINKCKLKIQYSTFQILKYQHNWIEESL